MSNTKIIIWGIVLLSIISCSAPTPDLPVVSNDNNRENNAPKLEKLPPVQQKIVDLNEKVPEIVLMPEKTKLSLGEKIFVEIFLVEKGKKTPVSPDEAQLSADRGYFQGVEYHAPRSRGAVLLKVFYPAQKISGQAEIQVIIPKISGKCKGAREFFRGQQVNYSIDIENEGQMVADQNYLVAKIPEGLVFKQANKNGKYQKLLREISWKINTIGAGGRENVKFTLYGEKLGERKLGVSLHTGTEEVWNTSTPIKVVGECALEQQVTSTNIRMGEKVTVKIAITAWQKVSKVLCEYRFPDQLIFISAKARFNNGTFRCKHTKNKIFTHRINKLDIGQKIELEIELQAKRTGKFQNTLTVLFYSHEKKRALKSTITINAY